MWCYRRVLRVLWTGHRTNEWILSRLEVEKTLLADVRKLRLSYYGHTMKQTQCLLQKDIIQACFQVAEVEDNQEYAGEMISAIGRDFGSMMQRTGAGGEVLEDDTRHCDVIPSLLILQHIGNGVRSASLCTVDYRCKQGTAVRM